MRMTALVLSILLALTVVLTSCEKKPDERLDAIESMITMRIDAADFDGAMEVLDNCDKDILADGKEDELRTLISKGANEYISKTVDEIIAADGYKKAYEYLDAGVPTVIDDESLSAEKERVRQLMIDSIFSTAEEAAKEQRYPEAIDALGGLSDAETAERANEAREKYKAEYAAYVLATDKEGTHTDDEMTELLSQAYAYTENSDVLSRLKAYRRPKDIAALTELKDRLIVDYNGETKAYTVRTVHFNDFVMRAAKKRGGMLSAGLSECEGEITYLLVLAYSTDELLQTEEMLFNCDGLVYSFSVEEKHREEKIIDLDFDLEICGIFDSSTSERYTLSRLMAALEKAEKVVVTARGVTRDMDFDISSEEIGELMSVWNAYIVLKENPELFANLSGTVEQQ